MNGGIEVLGRIGFLSEDRDLPMWMRVDDLLRYTAAFYPSWDASYATALRGELGLRPRPDGAGWAWYCLVKLEAALVPLRVSDPQAGQTIIQRDLWPETVLLDWSAG